jgi:hypothetical protein
MRAAIELSALPPPSGATPAARRRALAAESDDAIGERLLALARALRKVDAPAASPLAAAAGLPIGELLASPFALRIVALAVRRGATTVHGDLRQVLSWPKSFAQGPGTDDPDHGTWDRGVLHLGKFQQFLEDEPFATFHPDHIGKWGPHELMHRACGFFLRPGCSRWELYLGARLNELLPVVTWYGVEQAMRLDEHAFDRALAGRAKSASVADARWMTDDEPALEARAVRAASLVRDGLAHFERELAAIDEEIATGRRVPVAHPFLDASSDAVAYVAAHGARLTETGASIAALVPLGPERYADIRVYRDAIETIFDRLLFETIDVDLEKAASGHRARALWDLLQRGLQVGGRLGKAVTQAAGEAGPVIAKGLAGETIDLETWLERLEPLGEAVLSNGDRAHGGIALGQLTDGIASCAPQTLDRLGEDVLELLAPFAESESMLERAPLGRRFAAFLHDHDDEPSSELASFEAEIAAAARGDDRIERLCEDPRALPEDLSRVLIVRSEAFSVFHYESDVAALHAGAAPRSRSGDEARHAFAIGAHGGEVAVVDAPAHVVRALDALAAGPRVAPEVVALLDEAPRRKGWPEGGRAWLLELMGAGVLGWTPIPESVAGPRG